MNLDRWFQYRGKWRKSPNGRWVNADEAEAEIDRLQAENEELRDEWNAMANREKDHVTTAENLKCEVNRLRAEIAIAEKARQACES